ncbi:unnamed protein product [Cyprideis torosa]|uniref:Kazal-like domain-containing protein n=1 Tax=Cyprideis torosa TaxID=163714 RepID=A0A7R8W8I2_9CRUS|nr:unnamed protein product [Cyprideis torosa]CAG0886258.1 unnamed protein product [Cyprideis torosa]
MVREKHVGTRGPGGPKTRRSEDPEVDAVRLASEEFLNLYNLLIEASTSSTSTVSPFPPLVNPTFVHVDRRKQRSSTTQPPRPAAGSGEQRQVFPFADDKTSFSSSDVFCYLGNRFFPIGLKWKLSDSVMCVCHRPPKLECSRTDCPPLPDPLPFGCEAIVEPWQCPKLSCPDEVTPSHSLSPLPTSPTEAVPVDNTIPPLSTSVAQHPTHQKLCGVETRKDESIELDGIKIVTYHDAISSAPAVPGSIPSPIPPNLLPLLPPGIPTGSPPEFSVPQGSMHNMSPSPLGAHASHPAPNIHTTSDSHLPRPTLHAPLQPPPQPSTPAPMPPFHQPPSIRVCSPSSCPPPRVCRRDEHYGVIKCMCPTDCPETYSPVCGSNGRTYRNTCDLNKAACLEKIDLQVSYPGQCLSSATIPKNPCSRVSCRSPRTCQIVKGKGSCECVFQCPSTSTLTPQQGICGSNSKSYPSLCHLEHDACVKQQRLQIKHYGPCRATSGVCATTRCSPYKMCRVTAQETAQCVCPSSCPLTEGPSVCGSDGETYPSECHMIIRACLTSRNITIVHPGACAQKNSNPCSLVKCHPPRICRVGSSGSPECQCPLGCLPESSGTEEVCGSNGKTYASICKLESVACSRNMRIGVTHHGPCARPDPCLGIHCIPPRICKALNGTEATCVCEQNCPRKTEPVCASDNYTYKSKCHMEVYACKTGQNLRAIHVGECKEKGQKTSTLVDSSLQIGFESFN